MKMSFSRSSRLSRKRKNDDSQQESSQFDITVDDFQEDGPVFRLPPKRSKPEKVSNPRGKSKKVDTDIEITKNNVSKIGNSRQKQNTENISDGKKASSVKDVTDETKSKETDNRLLDLDDDSLFKKPNLANKLRKKSKTASNKDSDVYQNDDDTKDANVITNNDFDNADIEKDKEFLELEQSICTSYEKLCHCCKHIVPSSVFTDHLKECMQQKFKNNTRATRSTANTSENSEKGSKNIKEIKNDVEMRKENSETNKCQICSKVFKYPSERIGHVKGCALKHGITLEELKQATGKNENTVNQNKDNKPKRSRSKKPSNSELKKDPDLAVALALSRSLAEEEAAKRSQDEEKLLAMGLGDIVQEDRKERPVAVFKQPPPPDKPQKGGKSSKRKKRGAKTETVLMQRSNFDRERIISEKVATLLAADDNPLPTWDPQKNYISKHCLAAFQDQSCSLWSSSHCTEDEPLDNFYVQELITHIKPQNIEVGGLFRRLSQIPGRLNATASLEDSDSDDGYQDLDVECSVAEAYRTQLILAELMGSQEGMDFTVDDHDEGCEINISETAKSGFLFMQNEIKGKELITNNSKNDIIAANSKIREDRNDISDMLAENSKIREDRNYISKDVGIEIEINMKKDSSSSLNKKESELNEITINDNSKNKTFEINEDVNKVHLLHNQTESNMNETNQVSPRSPVKKRFTLPIINQDREIIDVPDDDEDDDDIRLKTKFDNDVNLRSGKTDSPKTGWISRTKENDSVDKSKSPCVSPRNVSRFKIPKSIDNTSIEERKIKFSEKDFNRDVDNHPKQSKKDTSDLNFTNLLLEELEKNNITLSKSPANLLNSDTVPVTKEDQVLNKNSKSNIGTSEVTPKRDLTLKKKPLNKKLLSTFNQVSNKDDENKTIYLDGKQTSSELENENININNCNPINVSSKEKLSKLNLSKNSLDNTKITSNNETAIFNRNETNFQNKSVDKTMSPPSISGLQNNKNNFDNEYEFSLRNSREKMKEKVISDWGLLFESGDETDTQIITKGGQILKCHSLVFIARCKQLFMELKVIDMKSHSIKSLEWKDISYNVAYKFIEYIYSGKCEIVTRSDSMWVPLFNLAQKYKASSFVEYLEFLDESIKISNEKSSKNTIKPIIENQDKDHMYEIDTRIQPVVQSIITDERISTYSPVHSFTPRSSYLSISKSNKDFTAIDGSQSPDLFDEDGVDDDLFECCEEEEEKSKKTECIASVLEQTIPFKSFTPKSNNRVSPQSSGKSFLHKQDERTHEILSEEYKDKTNPNNSSKDYKSLNINTDKNILKSPTINDKDLSLQKLTSPDSEEIMEIEQSPKRKSPLSKESEKKKVINPQEPQSEIEAQVDNDVIDLTVGSEPESSNSSIGSPHRDPTSSVHDSLNTVNDIVGAAKEIQSSVECNNTESCNDSFDVSLNHRSHSSMKKSDIKFSKLQNLNMSTVRKAHTLSFKDTSGDVDSSDVSFNHSSLSSMKDVETKVSKLQNLNMSSVRKSHTLSFRDTSGDVDFFDDEDTEDMDPLILGGDTSNSEADDPVITEKNKENDEENLLWNKSYEEDENEILCAEDAEEKKLGNKSQEEEKEILCADGIEYAEENLLKNKSYEEEEKEILCADVIEDADDNEMNNSYINNVWDDFDDMGMGCDMAAGYVPSPVKAPNIQGNKTNSKENKKNKSEIHGDLEMDSVEADTEESFILKLNEDEDNNDEISNKIDCAKGFPPKNTNEFKDFIVNKEKNSFKLIEMDDNQFVSDDNDNLSGKSSVSDTTLLRAVDDAEGCDWNGDMTMAEETRNNKLQENLEKDENKTKQRSKKDQIKTPAVPRKKSVKITPRPDYKNMVTPELKKELSKYGIRPISKNKAVQLLTHVYEQTHPVVTDSEAETSYCETPPPKPAQLPEQKKGGKKNNDNILRKKVLTKMQQSSTHSSQNAVQTKSSNKMQNPKTYSSLQSNLEEEKEELLNSSQDSNSSDGSDNGGCAEETILMPERNEEENQDDILTATQQGDIQSRVSEFIKQDADMRMKVLLYEPIWIRELQANLKLNGIKCSMANLMDILDQQCVTFRSEKVQKKGKGRTRKKPK